MQDPGGIPDILLKIIEQRKRRLAPPGAHEGVVPSAEPREVEGNPFLEALRQKRGRAVIAEVKMGSPKLGSLVGTFDPEEQAKTYAAHGAAALSVVVEPDFFYGSYDILARCRRASGLPAIAKDFIVDEVQLRWAQGAGADAILLIASLYPAHELADYARRARQLGLVPLVETHDPKDLEKLEGDGWELVGINNRDLRTFQVNLDHSIDLLPRLPTGALKVAESGIHGRRDVERLKKAGFDAFLIGETLLLAEDPAVKLGELLG